MLNTLHRHIYTMHGIASVGFTWVPQKEYWIYSWCHHRTPCARFHKYLDFKALVGCWWLNSHWTRAGKHIAFHNIIDVLTHKRRLFKTVRGQKTSWAGEWTAWKPVSEIVPSQHCPPPPLPPLLRRQMASLCLAQNQSLCGPGFERTERPSGAMLVPDFWFKFDMYFSCVEAQRQMIFLHQGHDIWRQVKYRKIN